MTLDPQVLEKVKSIGDDKYLDDNRDRDRVADGNQQCPISWILYFFLHHKPTAKSNILISIATMRQNHFRNVFSTADKPDK